MKQHDRTTPNKQTLPIPMNMLIIVTAICNEDDSHCGFSFNKEIWDLAVF